MASRKTCDKCAYYITAAERSAQSGIVCEPHEGACLLICDEQNVSRPHPRNRLSTWDYEGYRSGANVPPKFGCIHWLRKSA